MKSLGRYEVIDELGRGTMGAVYKAKDPIMDRDVAIKTILTQASQGPEATEFRERFFREAKAAGRLAHPGIITVFDVALHEATPFLVMEYVPGQTLQSILQSGRRLDMSQIYDWAIQLAEALDYAHTNGVIHRDIKPANILITNDNRTKIADFGVAKLMESSATYSGQLLGTPAFMAPEQFAGLPIDGRADLFALGVVIYWMASGEKPFAGDTVLSVQYKVVNTDPLPPRKLNPTIAPGLELVILKSIQKDPAERYQSGAELARDLRTCCTAASAVTSKTIAVPAKVVQVPVVLPADGQTEMRTLRLHPTVPRRQVLFGSLAIAALALIVLIFTSIRTLSYDPPPPPVALVHPPVPDPMPARIATPPAAETPRRTARPRGVRVVGADETQNSTPVAATSPAPPQPETTPPSENTVSTENRTVVDSTARQNELAASFNSARLMIMSPAVPNTLTVIVTLNNALFFRRDAAALPPSGSVSLLPLAEELTLPPGRHKVEVNILAAAQRVGRAHEFTVRFDPRQRRTLNIQIFPDSKGAGIPVRVDVTLK